MLVPISWIKELVNLDGVGIDEIAHKMFMTGFEVEEVFYLGKNLSGVYVGLVKEKIPHPSNPKLSVLSVEGKNGQIYKIVTAYPHIQKGDRPLFCVEGATLRPLKKSENMGANVIKGKDFYGVYSEGMLLSGAEICLSDANTTPFSSDFFDGIDKDKVLFFDKSVPAGTDGVSALGLDEYVFDVSITSNRPDCQSIVGLSKEVAAIFNKECVMPDTSFTAPKNSAGYNFTIENRAPDGCYRYIGHYIDNVKIIPSPLKMRKRLTMCGINAINGIVDVTNYVLKEFGQPMHAFDVTEVEGDKIIVRYAKNGEKIKLLTNAEHNLTDEDLIICNASAPMALAGVMGGADSGIKPGTKAVIYEIAKFSSVTVRNSARRAGVSTESSQRFSKGVNDYYLPLAYRRALHLTQKYGFGEVTNVCADENTYNYATKIRKMSLSVHDINKILGISVPPANIKNILERLEFGVELSGKNIELSLPPYRFDIEDFPDIAEEVIRIYGYDKIKPTMLKGACVSGGGLDERQKLVREIKNRLKAMGYFETVNFAFCSPKDLELFGFNGEKTVKIANPLNENYSVMRSSLLPQAVRTLSANYKQYGNRDGKIFEIGRVFCLKAEKVIEKERLSMAVFGKRYNFFDLKGAIEALYGDLGINLEFKASVIPFFNPGISADIFIDGRKIGYAGQLSYELADECELGSGNDKGVTATVAELELDSILSNAVITNKYKVPAEPKVRRDFSLTVPNNLSYADVKRAIYAAKAETAVNITDMLLVEKYTGDKVDAGCYGLTVRVTMEPAKSLYDPEKLSYNAIPPSVTDIFTANILKSLKANGVTLRG